MHLQHEGAVRNYHDDWTDLATVPGKFEKCVRKIVVSDSVSAILCQQKASWREGDAELLMWLCQNGKQESASMTPLCEVVQFVSHPACDGGISLGLGDQVAQQGAGAEEAQADVGGLCEVSQHWRVGEVFRPRPTVDKRNHNLEHKCTQRLFLLPC